MKSIAYSYPASIIMLVHNNLEITRQTVESIFKNTTESFQFVILDNGSGIETKRYLQSLTRHNNVKLMFLPKNYGFPKAVNYGIGLSEGEHIVLVNNDIVVPFGWLERLVKPLKNESIAIVSPLRTITRDGNITVHLPPGHPEVWKRRIPYMPGDEDRLVAEINKEQKALGRGLFFTRNMVAFFCVALSRKALNTIGYLDEDFGLGLCEDDYYCELVVKNNFRIAINTELFCFHHTSTTVCALFRNRGRDEIAANHRVRKEKHRRGYTNTRHDLQPLGVY